MVAALVLATGCDERRPPAKDKAPLELLILSSGEKARWIEETGRQFAKARAENKDIRRVEVRVQRASSDKCLSRVLSGEVHAHLVSPSLSTLISTANAESPGMFLQPRSLFHTPQVFATTLSTAKNLGWPETLIGWRDLSVLASNPMVWKSKAPHPGTPFRFVLPDPESTTSGRLALYSMLVTACGRTAWFKSIDLERSEPAEFLSSFSTAITGLGSYSEPGLRSLCHAGSNVPSFVVTTEQEVYSAYSALKPIEPIVSIRPKEGCFVFDHPIALVNASWSTPEHRKIAADFVSFMLDPKQQEAANAMGFRPATAPDDTLAPLDPARGVDPSPIVNRFSMPDTAAQSMALQLWRHARPGADLLFILDLSASMRVPREDRYSLALRITGRLIDSLGPRDTAALLVFNHQRVLALYPAPRDEARSRIIETLSKAAPTGGSALFDSLQYAITENLAGRLPGRIPAIVVLTDGLDVNSEMPFDQLQLSLANEVKAGAPPVFLVGFGGDLEMDVLGRIARSAEGRVYEATEANADDIADDIAGFL